MKPMSEYQLAILMALQAKPIYAGTVPREVLARRHRRNKAARIARRAHRKGN
ncbi:hypothetical protein [Brachybacterium hainanense]|uniref:Uncharacterized protein n=1 Tax=Brachybacterium hainanense TaxID=1541174 RepID=A0ABV6R948_9MICO